MSETRLANIIIPDVFTDATNQPSIYRSRLINSGVMGMSEQISALLSGGGKTFDIKHFNDVSHTESAIPSETVATDVDNITQGKQVAVRLIREKAWGSNDLVDVLSGDNALQALESRVNGYWGQDYDKTAFAILNGIRLDNVANDSGDLTVGSATATWSSDLVYDALGKLGENGVIGTGESYEGDVTHIAMHPVIFNSMQKEEQIDWIKPSDNQLAVPFYMGLRVIVDRNLPSPAAGQYITMLFKSGSLKFGMSTNGFVPTELERIKNKGFGIDEIWTRKNYAIHVNGFSWTGTAAGAAPTNTEMDLATAWDRSWEAENSGVLFIHSLVAV